MSMLNEDALDCIAQKLDILREYLAKARMSQEKMQAIVCDVYDVIDDIIHVIDDSKIDK